MTINIPSNPDPAGLNPPTTGNIIHCRHHPSHGHSKPYTYLPISRSSDFYDNWRSVGPNDFFITVPSEDFGAESSSNSWRAAIDASVMEEAMDEVWESLQEEEEDTSEPNDGSSNNHISNRDEKEEES